MFHNNERENKSIKTVSALHSTNYAAHIVSFHINQWESWCMWQKICNLFKLACPAFNFFLETGWQEIDCLYTAFVCIFHFTCLSKSRLVSFAHFYQVLYFVSHRLLFLCNILKLSVLLSAQIDSSTEMTTDFQKVQSISLRIRGFPKDVWGTLNH